MRFSLLVLACLGVAGHGLSFAQTPAAQAPLAAPALTVLQAMRLAENASPAVKLRAAQMAAVEGARQQAKTVFSNNPELSLERSDKVTQLAPLADERSQGWSLGLTQIIETGGQQVRRREAADASLEALNAEIEDARRQARSEAVRRFYAVLAAERRIPIEQKSVELFELSAQAVARRRAAGEDTRLDANVAVVEAERARNVLALARERVLEARGELAAVLQLNGAALPALVPDPAFEPKAMASVVPPYDLNGLLANARALPKLKALEAKENVARARLALERASRYPDLTLGVVLGREGPNTARDQVTSFTLSLPLPVFKRNQAGIGQALSDTDTAEIERAAAVREQDTLIQRLWSRLTSQGERVKRLQSNLLPASADNQQLAVKSRQAGQIGLLEQLVINRQALDAERDMNDALVDYHTTRIELENAAGWSQEGASR